jgi:hypothetical protein
MTAERRCPSAGQHCDGPVLIEAFGFRRYRGSPWGKLELDNASFQPDDCGVGSIIGAQLGKDALDSTLDGLLGNRKLIPDLLVGISGRDQAQHADFCGGQGVIRRMLSYFVRDLRGKGLLPDVYRPDRLQEFLV